MTLGVSLLLVAAGAILVWGVTGEVQGIDVDAVGVILMVVGVIGFILSLIFWETWGRGPIGRRVTYVEGDAPVRRRTVEATPARRVVEEEVEEYPGPPPGAPPPP
jgi:hypothetical protein